MRTPKKRLLNRTYYERKRSTKGRPFSLFVQNERTLSGESPYPASIVKFEVPQRRQLASERTSLTLFAPAPSTISFVPLTRNLSLADPSPYPVRGWTGLSEATATRFKASTDCSTCPPVATVKLGNAYQFEKFGTGNRLLRYGIDIRCSKMPPGVRDAFSEAFGVKNRLFRYGRDIRYRKRPSGVPSIFKGALNSLLLHRMHFRKRKKRHPVTPNASSKARRTADSTDCGQLTGVRDAFSEACRAKNSTCRSGRRFSARNGPRSLCSLRRPLPLLLRRHSVPETVPAWR